MLDEKKTVPKKGTANNQEPLSLFNNPTDPKRRKELEEPKHPFVDRMISIETKLDQLIRSFREKDMSRSKTVILDNADFIQLFKISGKTAQNWRDEGLIEYSQVKGKIYYRAEDVEKLLNRSRR